MLQADIRMRSHGLRQLVTTICCKLSTGLLQVVYHVLPLFSGEKPRLVNNDTGKLTMEVGKLARLKCDFFNWKKEWKMDWYFGGKLIRVRKNKRFRKRDGESSVLKIKNLQKEDAGVYECVASNKYGKASRKVNLTVTGKFSLHFVLCYVLPLGKLGPFIVGIKKY